MQARMAQLVTERLTTVQSRIVELIEQAAQLQSSTPGDQPGPREEVASVQGRIVSPANASASCSPCPATHLLRNPHPRDSVRMTRSGLTKDIEAPRDVRAGASLSGRRSSVKPSDGRPPRAV